jgi:hypothetical protein
MCDGEVDGSTAEKWFVIPTELIWHMGQNLRQQARFSTRPSQEWARCVKGWQF